MAALAPGQTVETTVPVFDVDALPPGTYRFRLEVVDDAGNVSLPVERTVTVFELVVAQPVTVQPQPAPTQPTPTVTATPVAGIRFPTSTIRVAPTIRRIP